MFCGCKHLTQNLIYLCTARDVTITTSIVNDTDSLPSPSDPPANKPSGSSGLVAVICTIMAVIIIGIIIGSIVYLLIKRKTAGEFNLSSNKQQYSLQDDEIYTVYDYPNLVNKSAILESQSRRDVDSPPAPPHYSEIGKVFILEPLAAAHTEEGCNDDNTEAVSIAHNSEIGNTSVLTPPLELLTEVDNKGCNDDNTEEVSTPNYSKIGNTRSVPLPLEPLTAAAEVDMKGHNDDSNEAVNTAHYSEVGKTYIPLPLDPLTAIDKGNMKDDSTVTVNSHILGLVDDGDDCFIESMANIAYQHLPTVDKTTMAASQCDHQSTEYYSEIDPYEDGDSIYY